MLGYCNWSSTIVDMRLEHGVNLQGRTMNVSIDASSITSVFQKNQNLSIVMAGTYGHCFF